ncbi:MAG: ferredoxin family protein, partial [Pirellulaceae bacterium]|nr:ferredoxin family protein [Pirellulaceae bacterium]
QPDSGDDDDELEDELDEEQGARVLDTRPLPERQIYCVNLQSSSSAEDFIEEAERIAASSLGQWIQGDPTKEQLARFQKPVNDTAQGPASLPETIEGENGRRWYPVIDFSRCTNCMECIDFCLFGVYGVDRAETILVEQPDNCRKGCPACSRVCPENAIVFPQHKTPAIAGAPVNVGGLKIDLSLLFGKPEAADVAARERDEQLIMAGRAPVDSDEQPLEKRQLGKPAGPADELDALLDELETLE